VSCEKNFTENVLNRLDEILEWFSSRHFHPLIIQTFKNHPESIFRVNSKGCVGFCYEHWETLSRDLNKRGSEFVLEKLFMDKYKNWIGEDSVGFVREEYQKNK
jgi:hypothetical protein